jgi:hypothetical protein
MDTLIIPFYLFNRPLTSFARQTQTDAEILPPRPAEAKTSIASRYYQCLRPERHEAFAWAGRSGKKFLLSAYCLRVSAVKIFTYLSHTTGFIGSLH